MRRRLEADLERYLEYAAECGDRAEGIQQLDLAQGGAASRLEPTYLELPFGFPSRSSEPPDGSLDPSAGALSLDLAEGVSAPRESGVGGQSPGEPPGVLAPLDLGEGVLVRGFIDRVDLAPGGEAVVYDYKSSLPAAPDRWLGERNFQIALYMRAVEQLLGVRVAGGFYQPLSGRDLRARGVLRGRVPTGGRDARVRAGRRPACRRRCGIWWRRSSPRPAPPPPRRARGSWRRGPPPAGSVAADACTRRSAGATA